MANVDTQRRVEDHEINVSDADTEYSLDLPAGVKALEFRCRDATDIRHSFTQGRVGGASPSGPYQTLKSGETYYRDRLYLNKHTLYVAAGSGSKVVEVRVWL